MRAETWLGAFACAEGSQMCSGKQARLDREAGKGQPEQRRQVRLIAQGAKVPAARAGGQRGEEREQAERARMGGGEIKPARGPHLAAARGRA